MSLTETDISSSWEKICKKFESTHGKSLYNNWLKPVSVESYENGYLNIIAPTRFIKDWLLNNYSDNLNFLCREELSGFKLFSLETAKENSSANITSSSEENNIEVNSEYKFESNTDDKNNFKNYAFNETNKFALNAAKSISDKEDKNYGLFNSLYVHGGYGAGKTHLLQAIANKINSNKKDNRKAVYLSAEKFMFGFIKALRENDIISFKTFIRSSDVLLIDDIQFICGKQNIQEEFLHSFNAITEAGKTIIVACDRDPSKLNKIDDRLKARLCSGIVCEIDRADYELRLKALQAKVQANKLVICEDILKFLAKEISSSIRECEGALNKIIARSSLSGEVLNLENVISWVKSFALVNSAEVSFDKIRKAVCEEFNISENDLDSKSRARKVARPRQIAMYLCKKMTSKSFPEIGRSFGGRDHATVIHSLKSIEKCLVEDQEISTSIASIKASINR